MIEHDKGLPAGIHGLANRSQIFRDHTNSSQFDEIAFALIWGAQKDNQLI